MDALTPRLAKHLRPLGRMAQHHYSQAQAKLDFTLQHANLQPKAFLYACFIFLAFVWLATTLTSLLHYRATACPSHSSNPNLEKWFPNRPSERRPGGWPPSPFTRPTAPPYPDWSLTCTKPLPYRPFRHGPKYHITLGLRAMPWSSWIELDNQYLTYHTLKAQRNASRGTKCVRTAPEAYPAVLELLEELVEYLGERYLMLFSRTTSGGIRNLATGEEFDIAHSCVSHQGATGLGEDSMTIAARLVQDDLAIMVEREDGEYYLLAGAILLAGFWRLEDKFGMRVGEIHSSGNFPGFKEKLEKGMGNFFRRLKPKNPILRNNYFIQVDNELAWSSSIGNEDEEGIGWFTAEKNRAIQHHYFRNERQSLRRLPKSGVVVFTIRTYFHPIIDICKEPHVPGRLASAIRSWGDDVSKYKGKEKYGDVLLEYLDTMHEEQVKGGLDVSKEEEEGSGYPF